MPEASLLTGPLLQGRTCLITGAGSTRGIGFATASLFATHGARLVLADLNIDDDRAAELRAALPAGTEVIAMACDLRDRDSCQAVVQEAISAYGSLDVLVNSAGVVGSSAFREISPDQLDLILDVNLKGSFNICQSAVGAMETGAAIVNISSVAAQRGGGLVGGAHYAASKGGVLSLTRSLARELGPRGIRANAVCPSMTETGMLDNNMTPERFAEITAAIPLQRAGRAIEIAAACLFLSSSLSTYVTGITLDVNGGSHIH